MRRRTSVLKSGKLIAASTLLAASLASAANRDIDSGKWYLLTLPGDLSGPISSFLSDELTASNAVILYGYDSKLGGYKRLSPADEIDPSDGFWFIQLTGQTITADLTQAVVEPALLSPAVCTSDSGCFERPLTISTAYSSSLIGLPFSESVPIDELRIFSTTEECGEGCSITEAKAAGYTNGVFLGYEADEGLFVPVGDGESLQPEAGYWFFTKFPEGTGGATLVFPSPKPAVQPPPPEPTPEPQPEPEATNANLLFSSGFESGTIVEQEYNGYQRLTGVELESGFVWDESLNGLWGSSNNGIHVIDGGRSSAGIKNELRTVTGSTGEQTTALYQEIEFSDGSPRAQTPYQINNITDDPEEYYISFWLKMDDTSFDEDDKYRIVWQYKTDHFDYQDDRPGYRIGVYVYTDENGPYWHVKGDDQNPDYWSVSNRAIPVPQEEWFQVEIYSKVSSGNNGRFWAKINGEEIASNSGPNLGSTEDTMAFMMLWQLYGNADPKHQLVDNIQIWDGVPYAD